MSDTGLLSRSCPIVDLKNALMRRRALRDLSAEHEVAGIVARMEATWYRTGKMSWRPFRWWDHVSYGGPPPMHRSIYRSIQRSILDRLSVDIRSSIGRYVGRVSTDVSTDTPIGRYTWWFTDTSPILHRYFTNTSLILHRYFTDTAPMLHRYFSSYIGRHSTETRAVDKCSSIGRCICRYICRYIGR